MILTPLGGEIKKKGKKKNLSDKIPGGKLKTVALQAVYIGKRGGKGGVVTLESQLCQGNIWR